MAIQIQLRRGTAAQWASANTVLALAEIAVELETSQYKIGDGATHWSDLPYGGIHGPMAGTDGQVVFNNKGIANGSPAFTFNYSSNTLSLSNSLIVSNTLVVSNSINAVNEINSANRIKIGNDVNNISYAPQGGEFATVQNVFFANSSSIQVGNSSSYFNLHNDSLSFTDGNGNPAGFVNVKKIYANAHIGTTGQVLSSNSTGGLFWGTALTNGANTQVLFNDADSTNGSAAFTFTKASNTLNIQNISSNIVTSSNSMKIGGNFILGANAENGAGFVKVGPFITLGSGASDLKNGPDDTPWYAPQGGSFATDQHLFFANSSLIQVGNSSSYFNLYDDSLSFYDIDGNKAGALSVRDIDTDSITSHNVISNTISVVDTITINDGTNSLTINSTSFSGTSYNTQYVGEVQASEIVSNTQLNDNVSRTYANAVHYTDTVIGLVNTAIVSNASSTYANAVLYTDTKIGLVNTAIAANAATTYANAVNFASNASNISTGTLSELRLPYRMDQNIRKADDVEFHNITVTGMIVSGNVTVIGSNNLSISDNMIYLNANTQFGNPDLGFTGNYNDGTYHHAGFFRDHTSGVWKVFENYKPEPDASQYIDQSNNTFRLANFQANAFFIGNNSVYATLDNLNYSGTSNNSLYLNGNTSSDLRNYSITLSSAAYSNSVAYTNIVIGLVNTAITSNASAAYANAVAYVDNKLYVNTYNLSTNLSNYALLSGATFSGDVSFSKNVYTSTIVGTSGLYLQQQNAGAFLGFNNNGHEYKIYPSGQFEMGGALLGGSYGANKVDLTSYTIDIEGGNAGVNIRASNDRSTYKTWSFGWDGVLTLPIGGTISANGTLGTDTQVLKANSTGGVFWGLGVSGYTGSFGTTGYVGSQGNIGYTGSAGYAGSQGSTGYVGSAGSNGYAGSNGSNGYTGSIGVGYAGSSGYWAGGTMANTAYFSNTATTTNNVSGAVVILGGLGVNDNIYTDGRYGFANSSNIGVAYTVYNQTLNTIDTVFG